jgi:hypothetical protein
VKSFTDFQYGLHKMKKASNPLQSMLMFYVFLSKISLMFLFNSVEEDYQLSSRIEEKSFRMQQTLKDKRDQGVGRG